MMHPAFIILLIIILVILFLIVCLAFVPVDFSFILEKSEKHTRRVISVVWGVIGTNFIEIDGVGKTEFLLLGHPILTRARRDKEKKKPRPKMEASKIMIFVKSLPELRPYFTRLIRTFIKAIVLESIECDVKLGFSDPASTGLVYGFFKAFQSILDPIRKFRITLDPVFDREIMEGQLNARLRLNYPIRVIIPAIKLFIKKPIRQSMRGMR